MSDLIVKVVPIDELRPHHNADKLEVATIKGWEVCVSKGKHQVGDMVIFVPPDAMIPRDLADRWGVTKYLAWIKGQEKGRVMAVNLRGQFSYGFVVSNDDNLPEGTDCVEYYGLDKYSKPEGLEGTSWLPNPPMFLKYTDIQLLQNFPHLFTTGEEVIVTEKIDGTNCRLGLIKDFGILIGTRDMLVDSTKSSPYLDIDTPYSREFLGNINGAKYSVIMYGELYGQINEGRVKFQYDALPDRNRFRVFDIRVDGEFLPYSKLFEYRDLPMVPTLYEGPFDMDVMMGLAEGKTTIGDHKREGIVIRPKVERRDDEVGRVIAKIIGKGHLLES